MNLLEYVPIIKAHPLTELHPEDRTCVICHQRIWPTAGSDVHVHLLSEHMISPLTLMPHIEVNGKYYVKQSDLEAERRRLAFARNSVPG